MKWTIILEYAILTDGGSSAIIEQIIQNWPHGDFLNAEPSANKINDIVFFMGLPYPGLLQKSDRSGQFRKSAEINNYNHKKNQDFLIT